MKQKEYLHELIHNLGKNEKRYFKLLSNKSSGSKSYLDLFEDIEAQEEYDEEKIIGTSASLSERKKFAVGKNYLQSQILKSLRHYHEDISVKSRIHMLMVNVEVLFQKGLIQPAEKELKKARNLAFKHEKFGLLQEVLNWERQISATREIPFRDAMEIAIEEKFILSRQRNVLQYQNISQRLVEFKRKYGYIRGERSKDMVARIMSHKLLSDIDQATSQRSRYFYHLTYSNYYYMVGDFTKSYEHSHQILQLDHTAIDESEQLNALLYHIPTAYFVSRYDEVLQFIQIAQNRSAALSIGNFEHIKMTVYYHTAVYGISGTIKAADFTQARILNEKAERDFPKYERQLKPEWREILIEVFALTCFIIQQPQKTVSWSNKLLRTSTKNTRMDVLVAVRILHLMALYEIDDMRTMGYALSSALRSTQILHKKEPEYAVELAILNALKKVPGHGNSKAMAQWAGKLHQNIHKIISKDSMHASNEYDTILKWLQSKMERTPIMEVMRSSVPSQSKMH